MSRRLTAISEEERGSYRTGALCGVLVTLTKRCPNATVGGRDFCPIHTRTTPDQVPLLEQAARAQQARWVA